MVDEPPFPPPGVSLKLFDQNVLILWWQFQLFAKKEGSILLYRSSATCRVLSCVLAVVDRDPSESTKVVFHGGVSLNEAHVAVQSLQRTHLK